MRNPLKLRLVGFSAIIVILAGLIGWATWASWRELGRLEDRFSRGQIRSFEIADHLQATILRLNNALIEHQLTGSSNQLDEFRRASKRLNEWIDEKKPDLDSARERALLNRIDIAYDSFLATAHSAIEARALASPERRVQLIGGIIEASSSMLDLGSQLEDAHRLNLESLFVGQQKSLLILQWVISSALFVLVVLGGLLALIVFRDMIRPLQTKLVESHAIIERQEKLASLGVLAAGVAHEIRTPLTAIKARLYRQQTALDPASTAHQDALVIDGEINRLERIVKDVLKFARPSERDFAPLLVRPFLEEVRELMAGQLEKRGVTLRVEANGTPDEVLADHDQLKQVLLNVVQNADRKSTRLNSSHVS